MKKVEIKSHICVTDDGQSCDIECPHIMVYPQAMCHLFKEPLPSGTNTPARNAECLALTEVEPKVELIRVRVNYDGHYKDSVIVEGATKEECQSKMLDECCQRSWDSSCVFSELIKD